LVFNYLKFDTLVYFYFQITYTDYTVNDVTTVGANVIIKDAFSDSAQNDETRLKNELTGITLNIHVRCIA